MKKIAFTSITVNYLPKARVLAHSVKRHADDVSFVLIVAEPFDHSLLRKDDPFDRIITVEELGIPNLNRWLFTHTVVEACTAIKGRALLKLLEGTDDAAVVYFDPDIVVTNSLSGLFAEFAEASILLTPHGIEPETETQAIRDNEISHLRYGVYNLGFVAVRNTAAGLKFAGWWAQRLHDYCYDEMEAGIFTDQRWVDLATAFFDGVKVLRDPGYNVATWNLSHRVVTGSLDGGLSVNGRPLVFYHFSGFDSGAMETMLGVYGGKSPVLNCFRRWYIQECEKMGQSQLGTRPWRYATFENGEPITNAQRRLYRDRRDFHTAFENPFAIRTLDASFLHWYLRHGCKSSLPCLAQRDDYQIVVMAVSKLGDVEDNFRQLLERTANKSRLTVAGTADVCGRLATVMPGVELIEVSADVVSGTECEAWMLAQIADSQAPGLIFVQLGLDLPELWDLRLCVGARRQPAIVTASPLYDGMPLTALLTPETNTNNTKNEEIDRIVCNLEDHLPLESSAFLEECFYVDTVHARAVLHGCRPSGADKKGEIGLLKFARECSLAGYFHVIVNDLYIGCHPTLGHQPVVVRPHGVRLQEYEQRNALNETRCHYQELLADSTPSLPTAAQRASRRHLHITHAWGGGLAHWVQSYGTSDGEHVNMMLKPVGERGAFGNELQLYASVDAPAPIASWKLPVPIKATVPASLTYQRILESIVADYGIDVIFVSTLIGHSMDVLRTGLTTVFICHDFFPLTPEIYIRSRHLSGGRVVHLSVDEAYENGELGLFPSYSRTEARAAIRTFNEILARRQIKLVAPSPSTRQFYLDLAPGLHPDDISVIPHGTERSLLFADRPAYAPGGRLRIAVPGRVASEKGRALLAAILPTIGEFADVLLLGSGLEGQAFADVDGVQVISRYAPADLPKILRDFQPHLGLLLSDFPETFSYTLDELFAMAVPPVAVRIGALADRIRDGENGFLVENDRQAVIGLLRCLDHDRDRLASVRDVLESIQVRTEDVMIREYEQLLKLPRFSSRAINARTSLPHSAYAHVSHLVYSPLRRLEPQRYLELISRIHQVADDQLPEKAVVAVVSKGDNQLLRFRKQQACHFPQVRGGTYAGHHPANSGEAIAQVEALRADGVEFLLFPSTAFWWFEHYLEFKKHLDSQYREVVSEEGCCTIYALAAPNGSSAAYNISRNGTDHAASQATAGRSSS